MRNRIVCLISLSIIFIFSLFTNAVSSNKVTFQNEMQYEYYESDWDSVPDFNNMKPLKSGTFQGLRSKSRGYWKNGINLPVKPTEGKVAFRIHGIAKVSRDGKFLFKSASYNASELYINNTRVVSHQGSRGWKTGEMIELSAGEHTFTVLYWGINPRHGFKMEGECLDYKIDSKQWLYIGWENDYPKSWTFMGGTLAPGRGDKIQYTVKIGDKIRFPDEFSPDRAKNIRWYLAEGYLPVPASEWMAGHVQVKIQHFARRILKDRSTAIFTRVTLKNLGTNYESVSLLINTNSQTEIPLSHVPTRSDEYSMTFDSTLKENASVNFDFIALANGEASVAELKSVGSFADNYQRMVQYYKKRIEQLARPTALPDQRFIEMYHAAQIVMWESVVRVENGDYEMRASVGDPAGLSDYDRTFNHDVPNMVINFIKEGDIDLAKRIMESEYYQSLGVEIMAGKLDAIPKYIIPYATYLQVTGDREYFTPELKALLKKNSRRIHEHRAQQLVPKLIDTGHYGIMDKSTGLDNKMDFLVIDNFAALHGLAAYAYLSKKFNDPQEEAWAVAEMEDLNTCLNKALQVSMKRRGVDWYMANFDDFGEMKENFYQMGYSGNWIGTTLMMPTFPWGAELKGFNLGGTWKEHFDRSIEHALFLRNEHPVIPEGSWGAWWGHEYGTVYNAGMGFQTLSSENHRTLAIKNLEWLLDNQSAPHQWGESFDRGMNENDWTKPAADYETWGLGFIKQALLEACISVKTDGTVIIGRGIPDYWLKNGNTISWKDVPINNGKKLDFSVVVEENVIILKMEGDEPCGNAVFDLPIFVGNIASVTVDGKKINTFHNETGKIEIQPGNKEVRVVLK